MKILLSLLKIAILSTVLSACARKSKPVDDTVKESQSSGNCSPEFVIEYDYAEFNLNTYKQYGLRFGKELIESHITFKELDSKYGTIHCTALEKETGELKTVTNSFIKDMASEAFHQLREAYFNKCRDSDVVKTSEEKSGCSRIKIYMEEDFNHDLDN